jgi:hypothetical protein
MTKQEGNTSIGSDDALVSALAELRECAAAIEALCEQHGDAADGRDDYLSSEARRDHCVAVLANQPAVDLEGLRAKAEAMQVASIRNAFEDHGDIGASLAQDCLRLLKA